MSHRNNEDFLATAVSSIAKTVTATNGTDFTSRELGVPTDMATLTIVFTGEDGMDGSDVDFYFQASYDGGSRWTTNEEFIKISKATYDTTPYLVRHSQVDWYQGISHIRLWKVTNGDTGKSITAVNATLSWGRL